MSQSENTTTTVSQPIHPGTSQEPDVVSTQTPPGEEQVDVQTSVPVSSLEKSSMHNYEISVTFIVV